jgi:uncharacterized membrane protein
MKAHTRFIILIIFFISFVFSFTNSSAIEKTVSSFTMVTSPQIEMQGLTYQRVFKDGIWWIYVYDGTELVDVYPE